MKTLHLKVENNLYGTLLAMLKELPASKIEIVEHNQEEISLYGAEDIMEYAGKITSFAEIKDPVAWQREIRAEWDREWE